MSRFVLLACVDGSDLHEVAERIRRDLDHFVASHHWSRPTWVVDEIAQRDRTLQPGDLPNWTLGLNHELPDEHASGDWFQDVEFLAVTIGGIAADTGRTFVLCLADTQNGTVEDFASLTSDRVDLEKLRLTLEAVQTEASRDLRPMTRANHDRTPSVYADFHKAFASPWTPGLWAVPLVCGGTFVDLSRLGLRLVEGLALAPSMEDVEYDGIARYDHTRRRWCIEYDEATLREGSDAGCFLRDFLCWSCSQPAQWHGLGNEGRCQHCSADLGALWAPPE